eukprot:365542-Chlamydomonas_euryale.AAC.5
MTPHARAPRTCTGADGAAASHRDMCSLGCKGGKGAEAVAARPSSSAVRSVRVNSGKRWRGRRGLVSNTGVGSVEAGARHLARGCGRGVGRRTALKAAGTCRRSSARGSRLRGRGRLDACVSSGARPRGPMCMLSSRPLALSRSRVVEKKAPRNLERVSVPLPAWACGTVRCARCRLTSRGARAAAARRHRHPGLSLFAAAAAALASALCCCFLAAAFVRPPATKTDGPLVVATVVAAA